MSVVGGPDIITDGLVLCLDAAYKKSYSGTGTTWYDSSGNNNHGTLTNGPTFDGNNGGSMVFDGTNDYIEGGIIEPTFFTLSSTFKSTGDPSNNDQYGGVLISNCPQLFGGVVQYVLSYSSLEERLLFMVQSNGTPHYISNILENKIYNVFAVYDGSYKKIYINGLLSGTFSWTTNPVYPTSGNRNVQIGRWGYGGYTRHINGHIYESKIYNRALSAAEIQQNFNATKGRFGL